MKRSIQQLTATLSAFCFIAAADDAWADSKQKCAMAYEKTQTSRGQGKLVDARKQALACSASVCSQYVTQDCAQWLAEIDTILPTVVLTAVDAAGAATTAVRVTVDGQALAEQLDGKAVPVDPGQHLVRFEMGAEVIEQKVLIRQDEKNRLLTASFKKAPPVVPTAASMPPPTAAVTPTAASVGGFWNSHRIDAIAAGAVGLAGIGVGAAFGATAFSQWGEALSHCNKGDKNDCGGQGIALGKAASTSAIISDIGFIVGGLGLAAGALLLILAPKSGPAEKGKTGVRVTPVVGQHGLGTLVEGSF